ncbi:hypothetical protein E2562_029879 [Oryza meyeriana var. granulata]|uniref:Uncharacterized protein n=1 Tax=Oryza meyeriana var. granulata TaxID=110450 RepID=A0A6G1CUL9_9ORYZ|nr:hypothetical protein E2562_029879 [Oryza meyeriana var. granulata]
MDACGRGKVEEEPSAVDVQDVPTGADDMRRAHVGHGRERQPSRISRRVKEIKAQPSTMCSKKMLAVTKKASAWTRAQASLARLKKARASMTCCKKMLPAIKKAPPSALS